MSNQTKSPENESTSAFSEYVNVLVVGADLGFAKQVQLALQSIAAENPEKGYRVFPGVNKEKILESIEKFDLHTVIIEEEILADTTPEKYLIEFQAMLKKNPKNEKVPMLIATLKSDGQRTRALVRGGWSDVLLKPLDRSLFLQKMNIYHKGRPIMKEAALFSMEVDKEVDLSFLFQTKSVSEYGMKVNSNRAVPVGTVLTARAAFIPEGVSAQVIESVKVSEDVHTLQLLFVGVTPAETQAIRKFIRQEYAEEKQAA